MLYVVVTCKYTQNLRSDQAPGEPAASSALCLTSPVSRANRLTGYQFHGKCVNLKTKPIESWQKTDLISKKGKAFPSQRTPSSSSIKKPALIIFSFIVATVADLLRSLIPTVNPSSPKTDIRNNGRSPYGLRPLLLKSPFYWMVICLTASFFAVTSFFGR